MKPKTNPSKSLLPSPAAFSLIELLVVVGIIAILAVLAIPAMNSVAGGTGVTGASEELLGAFNLARQRATTFNRQVALRFWKDGQNYKSYQLWEQEDSASPNTWRAADRARKFPVNIAVTNSATFSSMLARQGAEGTTNGRTYAEVLFTPAGAAVLSTNETALTLIQERGPQTDGVVTGLPPNFATIVIEPFNGIPRLYRP